MIKVLFVCLGNICRSPMAEAVFRKMVLDAGLSGHIEVDSCGTSGWHIGELPHRGMRELLQRHNIPFDNIYASALERKHYYYDYIIAMDEQNLKDIRSSKVKGSQAEIMLLSHYCEGNWISVPDPWYTGNFELAYRLISEGCRGLLDHISKSIKI